MIDRRQFIAMLSTMSGRLMRPFRASPGLAASISATAAFGANSVSDHILRSQSLEVDLLTTGAIARITNQVARETYTFSQDNFVITTSRGVFSNRDLAPEAVENADGILSCRFRNKDEYLVSLR